MIYTLLIQHNVTKKTYSWIVDDITPESYYHQFELALPEEIEDGEYEYALFYNPDELEIVVNPENIFKSHFEEGETEIETFDLLKIEKADKTKNIIFYEG